MRASLLPMETMIPSPIHTAAPPRGIVMWRSVSLEQADREFDYTFWQSQPPEARFAAAWEMVQNAWLIQSRPAHELRLQRTVIRVQPFPS